MSSRHCAHTRIYQINYSHHSHNSRGSAPLPWGSSVNHFHRDLCHVGDPSKFLPASGFYMATSPAWDASALLEQFLKFNFNVTSN
jgi:hypothetical protein